MKLIAIYIYMDGTLLNFNMEISDKNNEYFVYICSGRETKSIREILYKIDGVSYTESGETDL